MRTYFGGFDPGNGDSTLCIMYPDLSERCKTIPSYIALGTLDALVMYRGGLGRFDQVLNPDEFVLSMATKDGESAEVYVGDLALTQGSSPDSAIGDINRYWNNFSLQLLLTLAGSMIDDTEFELRIVTGLPIRTCTIEKRQQVQGALSGEFVFKLNGKARTARIWVGNVIMEGAGALIAHGKKTPDTVQGVVDIGQRTTDIYVAKGQEALIPRCEMKPIGVGNAIDYLIETFNAKCHRLLSDLEARELLRAYVERRSTFVNIGGQRVDAAPYIKTAISTVGESIASFVSKTLRTGEQGAVSSDVNPLYAVGGGPYYFFDALKKVIPHIEKPGMPELSNAQGYKNMAKSPRVWLGQEAPWNSLAVS